MRKLLILAAAALVLIVSSGGALAVTSITFGSVQEISDNFGDFGGVLDDGDLFGYTVANMGDLDGDGVQDLAVTAALDDDGGFDRGAVWILFMDINGKVKSEQKISSTAGDFSGVLDNNDLFGISVATLGDLDGDGVTDLAVGASQDDDGGKNRGAVWILFMDTNGKVKSEQKISDTAGDFGGVLDNDGWFGQSLANIGDLDGDGVQDLAVGASFDDDGGTDRGAVWILFMDTNGKVKSEQKISDTAGDFGGALDNVDRFGQSVANIGDLDGDAVTDLAVGAIFDDDGGTDTGALWILFLNTNGKVKSEQKISDTAGDFGGALDNGDIFGRSVASMGDLDGDGVQDLAVTAGFDDDGGTDRGAVWILFMVINGKVKSEQKISDTAGDFGGVLFDNDLFGISVANIGDLDGDGVTDLAVGERVGSGGNRGSVWILFPKKVVIEVDVDIKPEETSNCFNNDGNGVIPVALLSSATFDATQVDPASVQLEGLAVKAVGKNNKLLASFEDVNGDGLDDLVIKIEDVDGTFSVGDTTATITGNLLPEFGSTPITGTDSICIVQ